MKNHIRERFCEAIGPENVRTDEALSLHTTFRIGGPADYFLCPADEEQLIRVLRICSEEKIPGFIMGNGSNLLVSDDGYRGAVIQLFRNLGAIEAEGNMLRAQAGVLLSQAASFACEKGLAGLAFASGIPGTIGGAAVMNAGAYGGEMKDVLREVTILDSAGKRRVLQADELELGYRSSRMMRENAVILQVLLQLQPGDPEQIRRDMDELKKKRVEKQPLEYPSAGSTFKRPEGYFAGKLIMDAGLRGCRVGGAQVSEKHCGFVINTGGATAADVAALIRHVQKTVQDKFQVGLETEVRFLGEFHL